MADVQVALGGALWSLCLGLAVIGGHTQLPRLGEGLQVMGRHGPELEVRLVTEQPETEHVPQLSGSVRM